MSMFVSSHAIAAKPWRPKVLIYAPTHTGKTDAMLTFPGIVPVDVENRIDEFAARDDGRFGEFQAASVETLEQAREALVALKAGRVPCETIGLDSISALYIAMCVDATKRNEKNGRPDTYVTDYATVNRRMATFMAFVSSIHDKGVCFTAHEGKKWNRKGEQYEFAGAKLVSSDELRFAFGYIFRLERNGDLFVAHAEKSASPRLVRGQHFTYRLGERFYDAFRARCAPRSGETEAPASPPRADEAPASKPVPSAAGSADPFATVTLPDKRKVIALARDVAKVDVEREPGLSALKMLIHRVGGSYVLGHDHVEALCGAIKAGQLQVPA